MHALTVKSLGKRLGGQPILADVTLELAVGEWLCLVGPSGCGKSTLLRLIAGLDTPDSGSIDYHGQLALLFQQPRLLPWLTALDNVRLVLAQRDATVALHWLTQMQVAELASAYPAQLSGGQQRRVALARAFAIQPQLLLLDEPLVSLDAPSAEQLRTTLASWWQQQRASLLHVTHDLDEALRWADRIVFFRTRPAQPILHYPLSSPRPRSALEVAQRRAQLLTQYPELLSGLLYEETAHA